MPVSNRFLYADLLRIVAVVALVMNHVSGPLLYQLNTVSLDWFMTGNFLDALVQWDVPVFVMLSGALLLGREEPIGVFLKKRLLKILVPFIIWSVIYYLWILYSNGGSMTWHDIPKRKFIADFSTGNVIYHFWFVYMIFGLYLLTPIMRKFAIHASDSDFMYFFVVWLIANPVMMALRKYFQFTTAFELQAFVGWSGYFLLGYYLHTREIPQKIKKWFYILSPVSLLVIVMGTYFLTRANDGTFETYLYQPFNLPIVIMSVAVFLFFKDLKLEFAEQSAAFKWVNRLSAVAFQVYLAHVILINWVWLRLKINYELVHPIIGVTLHWIVTTVLTFALALVIDFIFRKLAGWFRQAFTVRRQQAVEKI